MKILVFTLLVFIISLSESTIVQKCPNFAKQVDNASLSKAITVGNCKKPPCRLRKDTFVDVEMKFKADANVDSLINTVNANILGIPFPFPGVDGTSACDNIYKGDKKVGCPLKAGEEYVYKSKIEVLKIYPRVKTVVHWGLSSPVGDLICFEVPARITN